MRSAAISSGLLASNAYLCSYIGKKIQTKNKDKTVTNKEQRQNNKDKIPKTNSGVVAVDVNPTCVTAAWSAVEGSSHQ